MADSPWNEWQRQRQTGAAVSAARAQQAGIAAYTGSAPTDFDNMTDSEILATLAQGGAGNQPEVIPNPDGTFTKTTGQPFTLDELRAYAAHLGVVGGVALRQRQGADGNWTTLAPSDTTAPTWGAAPDRAALRGGYPAPIYTRGDIDWQFAKMSPESRYTVLNELWNLGLLRTDPRDVPNTTGNDAVRGAIGDLLYEANVRGQTWQEALAGLRAEAVAAGTYGKQAAEAERNKRPPLTITLSSPADLDYIANAAARDLIGRRLTAGEMQAFIDSQQAAERAEQTATYNANYMGPDAGDFGPGGEVVAATSPSAAADEFVRDSFPEERRAMGLVGAFNTLAGMLAGPKV